MNDEPKRRGLKNPEWCRRYLAPENAAARSADYARRVRAAGLDRDDGGPEDMDEFRRYLARKIVMFTNDWPGCPERICRRMRGCMAPTGDCANHADDPPMTREEWEVARVKIRRALDKRLAECGVTRD